MRVEVERWVGDYLERIEVEGTLDECEQAGKWFVPTLKKMWEEEQAEIRGMMIRDVMMDKNLSERRV